MPSHGCTTNSWTSHEAPCLRKRSSPDTYVAPAVRLMTRPYELISADRETSKTTETGAALGSVKPGVTAPRILKTPPSMRPFFQLDSIDSAKRRHATHVRSLRAEKVMVRPDWEAAFSTRNQCRAKAEAPCDVGALMPAPEGSACAGKAVGAGLACPAAELSGGTVVGLGDDEQLATEKAQRAAPRPRRTDMRGGYRPQRACAAPCGQG